MDRIVKTLSADREAVIIAVDACLALGESMQRLHTAPPSMIHLGQAMLSGLLIQALPDRHPDERLSLQWSVNGPFGNLHVDCLSPHSVRGTIDQPQAQVMSLRTSLGTGLLQVRRARPGTSQEISTGIIAAQGHVSNDVLSYLEQSEQKLCAMNVFVDLEYLEADLPENSFRVRKALGYLVHVLPAKNPTETDRRLWAWHKHLESLRGLSQWDLNAQDPSLDILRFISGEKNPSLVLDAPVKFECRCNVSRAERALSLASTETPAESSDKIDQVIRVTCEYCGRHYDIAPAAKPTGSP
jgi:molecular chaperone Hsp33